MLNEYHLVQLQHVEVDDEQISMKKTCGLVKEMQNNIYYNTAFRNITTLFSTHLARDMVMRSV